MFDTVSSISYAYTMTLSQRNHIFLFGIGISLLTVLLLLISVKIIFPVFPDAVERAGARTAGLFRPIVQRFFKPEPYAVLASIFLSCLYAVLSITFVYFFFEKTQCQEILFFTFFAFSFCFEAFRVLIPLHSSLDLPRVYVILAARAILAGRFFGVLSLFTASIYAAGFQTQRQSNIILISAVIALIIAISTPIDALSWDSSLNITSGYATMLSLSEAGVILIAIISFFVSAYSRGSREFILIGVGAILVFLGRAIVLKCDTWISLPASLVLLAFGTWFICSRLHRVYLWL